VSPLVIVLALLDVSAAAPRVTLWPSRDGHRLQARAAR
jgi:hypothetical protein